MKIREKFDVFIDFSAFRKSFAKSARQFVHCDVLVLWDGAVGLGKFVSCPVCAGQGRLLSAKFAWLTSAENAKIWPNMPNPEGYADFSGPAGGRSLALAAPFRQARGL